MERFVETRREFLRTAGLATGALLLSPKHIFAAETEPAADYTVRIKVAPIEIAPNQILSTVTYNGQFPGPLLRFQEGHQVIVDLFNDTDTPEQLHWHGQMVPVDVDGAAEEGTPYIPAHGKRRISFTPKPAGLSLLSHAQSCWSRSLGRPIQRPGWTCLHRAQRRARPLRSRSLSCS